MASRSLTVCCSEQRSRSSMKMTRRRRARPQPSRRASAAQGDLGDVVLAEGSLLLLFDGRGEETFDRQLEHQVEPLGVMDLVKITPPLTFDGIQKTVRNLADARPEALQEGEGIDEVPENRQAGVDTGADQLSGEAPELLQVRELSPELLQQGHQGHVGFLVLPGVEPDRDDARVRHGAKVVGIEALPGESLLVERIRLRGENQPAPFQPARQLADGLRGRLERRPQRLSSQPGHGVPHQAGLARAPFALDADGIGGLAGEDQPGELLAGTLHAEVFEVEGPVVVASHGFAGILYRAGWWKLCLPSPAALRDRGDDRRATTRVAPTGIATGAHPPTPPRTRRHPPAR